MNGFVVAIMTAMVSSTSPAQSSILIFETVNDRDAVSFDPAKISDARLRQLILVSPHMVSYFNDFHGTDLTAARSDNAGCWTKDFSLCHSNYA